jgi:hypothetical protein
VKKKFDGGDFGAKYKITPISTMLHGWSQRPNFVNLHIKIFYVIISAIEGHLDFAAPQGVFFI